VSYLLLAQLTALKFPLTDCYLQLWDFQQGNCQQKTNHGGAIVHSRYGYREFSELLWQLFWVSVGQSAAVKPGQTHLIFIKFN